MSKALQRAHKERKQKRKKRACASCAKKPQLKTKKMKACVKRATPRPKERTKTKQKRTCVIFANKHQLKPKNEGLCQRCFTATEKRKTVQNVSQDAGSKCKEFFFKKKNLRVNGHSASNGIDVPKSRLRLLTKTTPPALCNGPVCRA